MIAMTFFCTTPAWAGECADPETAQWVYNNEENILKFCMESYPDDSYSPLHRCSEYPKKVYFNEEDVPNPFIIK
jgi:hypothetical protein